MVLVMQDRHALAFYDEEIQLLMSSRVDKRKKMGVQKVGIAPLLTFMTVTDPDLGPLLLTWFNLNHSMDEW